MKNKESGKTITSVVKDRLCTGCGTCVALCPRVALEMVRDKRRGIYVPKLIEERCNQCGICFDACPGHSVDYAQLNGRIFGGEPANPLIGNYTNCYLGHAVDHTVRRNASSGGLVSALLLHALEERVIDGALVTRMDPLHPLEPQVILARTKEEILADSQSKYCPVPANIRLREMLESGGKWAVVGLPCHIHGFRKAEMASKAVGSMSLLYLGIFCSHTLDFRGTEFLLHRLGIRRESVTKIAYRGGGWPGGIRITLKDGSEKFIPNQGPLWDSIFSSFFFTPSRCLLCCDLTNELADIAFGDAWLPGVMAAENEGVSVAVTRTARGEALLQSAIGKGKLALMPIDAKEVIESQKSYLYFKKTNLGARRQLFRLAGRRLLGGGTRMKSRLGLVLVALFPVVNSGISALPGVQWCLNRVPTRMLNMYLSLSRILCARLIRQEGTEKAEGSD